MLKLTFSHHIFSIQIITSTLLLILTIYNVHNYCAFVGPEIFLALYWSGYTSLFLNKNTIIFVVYFSILIMSRPYLYFIESRRQFVYLKIQVYNFSTPKSAQKRVQQSPQKVIRTIDSLFFAVNNADIRRI